MTTASMTRRTWRTGDRVEITATYTAQCDGSSATYQVEGLQRGETFPPCRGGQARAATFGVA